MNVFVLCTGRCGSTTFIEACAHIGNFSAAHESRSGLLGDERFNYPNDHIEADNRLSWMLGRLEKHYGDQASYVHLTRDTEAVAKSFVARYSGGIIKAYRGDGIIMGLDEAASPMDVARDYCLTVNSNIETFLRNKTRKMQFSLESAAQRFPDFCDFIGANSVDMQAALSEFQIKHNATQNQ